MRDIAYPHCEHLNQFLFNRLTAHPQCSRCGNTLFTGYPLRLKRAHFDRHLNKSSIPLVVCFCSPHCIPCQDMLLEFSQAAPEFEPGMRLIIINALEEKEIADRFAIYSIPSLVVFKNGNEKARILQSLKLSDLKEWVKSLS